MDFGGRDPLLIQHVSACIWKCAVFYIKEAFFSIRAVIYFHCSLYWAPGMANRARNSEVSQMKLRDEVQTIPTNAFIYHTVDSLYDYNRTQDIHWHLRVSSVWAVAF